MFIVRTRNRRSIIVSAFIVTALLFLVTFGIHVQVSTNPGTGSYLVFTIGQRNPNLFEDNNGCSSDSMNKRSQDDPCMVEHIRQNFLNPPPSASQPYNLTPGLVYENQYTKLVMEYFQDRKNGTYIEVGASDGETETNTLFFELRHGWRGLLIECNPVTLPKLKMKNRKAWIAEVCLSTTKSAETVNFHTLKEWPNSAQLGKGLNDAEMTYWGLNWVKDRTWYNYSLPAFPLYSIIMATQVFTKIDFLSIDVQGIEIEVLKNFPFEKFNIKLIIAEVALLNDNQKNEFRLMMKERGYKLVKDMGSVTYKFRNGFDYVFWRESLPA